MKKRFYILVIFTYTSLTSIAQITTWDYSVRVHGGTNNFYVNLLGEAIMAAAIPYVIDASDDKNFIWTKYMPMYDWNVGIPYNTTSNGTILHNRNGYFAAPWKGGVGDWNVGLDFQAIHLLSHFGYYINLDYKNRGFIFNEEKYEAHLLSPSAGVIIKILDFNYNVQPVIETGVGYDVVVGQSNENGYDKSMYKSGFYGDFALGLAIARWHTMFTIQYTHNFYNSINQNFEYQTTYPFSEIKRINSNLSIKITYFWKLFN